MCYNIKYTIKKVQQFAERHQIEFDTDQFKMDQHFLNAFQQASIPVVTNKHPNKVQLFDWGLIPHFIKSPIDAVLISRKTYNAMAETLYEKPSFRSAALERHCIILIDGFYEYHHSKSGKKIPFYIFSKDGSPLIIASIWESWLNNETHRLHNTVSIITTRADKTMEAIHNNPGVIKRTGSGRMPLMLNEENYLDWLSSAKFNLSNENVENQELAFYTVGQLSGKNGKGNSPEATLPFAWLEPEIPKMKDIGYGSGF